MTIIQNGTEAGFSAWTLFFLFAKLFNVGGLVNIAIWEWKIASIYFSK